MAKQLSPAGIMALKEALCSVYWYKSELRGFLQLCLAKPGMLNSFNWENYKRQIASDVVDHLVSDPELHLGDLTKICYELCKLTDFSHLKPLDDGPQKVEKARNAVNQLKQLVQPHQEVQKEQDDIKQRQALAAKKLRENAAVRQKLETIKGRYIALVGSNNAQSRGFELERVMYELFELFDLDHIIGGNAILLTARYDDCEHIMPFAVRSAFLNHLWRFGRLFVSRYGFMTNGAENPPRRMQGVP